MKKILENVSIKLTGVADVEGMIGAVALAVCIGLWWILAYALGAK